MKRIFSIFILLFLMVGIVSAGEVNLKSGLNYAGTTVVNLTQGETTFFDTSSGMLVVSSTLIDGVKFVPLVSKLDNKSVIWTTGEVVDAKEAPVFSTSFKYNGTALKETIVLKEEHVISYHLSFGQNQKLIPWDNGQFKVIDTTTGNTMKGIVASKPYGYDANGNYIEMWYTWDEKEQSLVLNYNKEFFIYFKDGTKSDKIVVTYPIVIDPTWFAIGTGFIYSDDTYTYQQWNATGATVWVAPMGVTSVDYLIVAGGGGGAGNGGAGGGGGGFLTGTTTNITPGNSYNVTVGVGGALGGGSGAHAGNGGNSTFSNMSAIGGGGAGGNAAGSRDGFTGGSGGGGTYTTGISGNPITGQGFMGGNCSGLVCTGGGGGAGAAGGAGTPTWATGGAGGIGLASNLSGVNTYYAGGGGGGVAAGNGGVGGFGGGGNGSATTGVAGTVNTGGGGGGGGTSGAVGGSGIVIIKYTTPKDVWFIVEADHYRMKNGTDIILEKWNHTGTFAWTPPLNVSVQYVVVAGGGGGGGTGAGSAGAGGGGAGGIVAGSSFNVINTSALTIVVGQGGGNGSAVFHGFNGTNSSLGNLTFNFTAIGGGGGGTYTREQNGSYGGSGGGSTYNAAVGAGVAGQGFAGGKGSASAFFGGGGGGGNQSTGQDGTATDAGDGGSCFQTDIVPLVITNLSGGGGGGIHSSASGSFGLGACLVGGNGTKGNAVNGYNAVPETGSGGGGAGSASGGGGDGGDGSGGVVIIKYSPSTSPVASFTLNNTFGLYPLSVLFTDTSTGSPPTRWNWSFGDGTWDNSTATSNPVHTYYTGGNYTVFLLVSNSGGSNQSPNQYITVFNQTISNITSNQSVIVVPPSLTVVFNGSNSTNASTFNYTFSDNTFQNGTDPNTSKLFSTGGIYGINLTTSDHNFGYNSILFNLIVHNQSIANFTTNSSTLIVPPNVQVWFNGTNSKNATFYNYSINGAWTNGTSQNISTIFSTGGTYFVNLTTSEDGYGLSTNSTTITVYNKTVTGFTSNVSSGLFNLPVSFNVTTPLDNATQWNWSFGDGTWQNGTNQNASHLFTTGGTYTITEIASNSVSSNTTTIANMITVYNVTNASFTSNVTTGYIPLSVQFNDLSSNATSWNWSFGDGNYSNLQNPIHTYEMKGFFSVNLTVNNTANISFVNKTNYIGVSGIVAAFAANNTLQGYYPMPVNFTDQSEDTPTMWNWSFGDGRWFNTTDPAMKNPVYTYAVAKLYTVNLTVSNAFDSNTTSKTNYINLTSDYDMNVISWMHFNNSQTPVFTDETGLVWQTSDSPFINTTNYQFADGSGDFTQAKAGLFRVSFATMNLGTGNFTIEMWLYPTSNPDVGATIFSRTTNSNYNNGWGFVNTNGTEYGYSFYMGDEVTNATPGIYVPNNQWTHVVIERTNGDISVYKNGILNSTKTGMGGTFDNGITARIAYISNVDYHGLIDEFRLSANVSRWKTNFTTPFMQYRGNQTYVLQDINMNSTLRFKTDPGFPSVAIVYNLTDTRNRTVQIQNVTHADFIAGSVVTNPLYTYITGITPNSSTYNDIQILSFDINNTYGILQFNVTRPGGFSSLFNNRTSIIDYRQIYYNYSANASLQTLYFTYGFLGNNSINTYYPFHHFLETNLTYGEWNITANITSNVTTVRKDSFVNFSAPFTGAVPTNWSWTFGDGTSNNGTNQTVVHNWSTIGIKWINLTESMWQNSSVFNTQQNYQINVTDYAPIANFSQNTTNGLFPLVVLLNDTSTGGSGTIWNWSFGDGTYSDAQNVTHIYYSGGNYTITFNVTNTGGSSTKVGYVDVWNYTTSPFSASPTSGLKPLQVTFTDTSSNGTTYFWMFGDGNTSTTKSPIYSYPNVGTFSVNHSVSNGVWTNWTNISNYISVGESAPIANFTMNRSDGLYPVAVQFTSDSVNALTYNWSFGDGIISALQNPVHTYTSGGTFIINLTVNNTNVTPSSAYNQITIWNLTQNDFTANVTFGNVSFAVNFSETSTNATSWFWIFDGVNTSTGKSPTFVYNVPGIYNVNHSSSNGNNTNWTNKSLYIIAYGPFINASYSNFTANVTQGTRPLNVLFTDLSNNTPTSWNWSFGDNTYSNLQNPTHIYSTSGLYTVTLNATNSNSTYHPMTKTNYINVTDIVPIANFTGTPLVGDLPLLVTFTDTSTGDPGTSWNWSFGDGNYSNLQNPTHTYDINETFSVTMRVNNSGGSDTKTRTDYILVTYPKSIVDFTANETFGYVPFAVQFTDLSTDGITVWNWSFGDGNYSNVQNPVHIYDLVGLMTVTLNVTNPGGFNETTKVAYINASATVYAPISSFVMNKTSAPAPAGVSFTDTSLFGPTAWNWSFGDGNYSNDQNTQYFYSHEGVFYIQLNVSNAFGFNISQQTLYIVNATIGGGSNSGSSSAQGNGWIDANTMLGFSVITIPAVMIMVYLIFANRKKEEP